MGIFRRSPSPAVPASAAAAASPSVESTPNYTTSSNGNVDHARLYVDRAYHSNPSSAMPSPSLSPSMVDHHYQQGSSRSRSPLGGSTGTSTSQTTHDAYGQRARSPALLTPSRAEYSSQSSTGRTYQSNSPSPQPGSTSSSNSNATSPWAGYLQDGQFTTADSSKSASKSTKEPKSKTAAATTSSTEDKARSTNEAAVELKRLELLNESRKSSTLDLARFSVNGMLNLVEQRMMMEDQKAGSSNERSGYANKAHGLGLSVAVGVGRGGGPSSSSAALSRGTNQNKQSPSNRYMHTVGEEAEHEEILSSSSSPSSAQYAQQQQQQQQGRARTASSASSGTTQLRDEVVDLLQLARKASLGTTYSASTSVSTSGSSGSGGSSHHAGPSLDMQQRPSISSVRTTESANTYSSHNAPQSSSQQPQQRANYGPGTASREELEELARAISPLPVPSTSAAQSKPKKKFGLFGGGAKKSDTSKEGGASISPTTLTSTSLEARAVSPLPPFEARTALAPAPAPAAAAAQFAQTNQAARSSPCPPVAGAHRNQVSAQHRRKRSMSVGDAVPFAILQSARQASSSSSNNNSSHARPAHQRLAKPDVYDESYFSSSKMPYYHSSLNDAGKKRSKQLDRLGLMEEDVQVAGAAGNEEESLESAKERLLAQSRTVVGYPSASTTMSRRREGPHVGKVSEAQYATYHRDTKQDSQPSAAASLSSFKSSNSSSSTSSKDTVTKRQGQHVMQDDSTGQFQLRNTPASGAGQPQVNVTSWTTPSRQAVKPDNKTRINRSNSDASVIDPFLPRGQHKLSPPSMSAQKITQLAVPSTIARTQARPQDSISAIGPPPTSPLPSPPRTAASLPGLRAPSPSQQMTLPPARSPAPTSPLPPLPAAIAAPPTHYQAGLPRPPNRAPPALPAMSAQGSAATSAEKTATDYGFDLRPHRTKQQGRTKISPLHERSPPETPALERAALGVAPRPFGTKGIVQRPPSALDMILVPSPSTAPSSMLSSSAGISTSSSSLSGTSSSGSLVTPKAREFNHEQLRRRQETSTTVASQYSTEGKYEAYDNASRSSAASSSGVSSTAMSQRVTSGSSAASGSVSSSAGHSHSHTTLSSATSYSSSSMSSYITRPSLSMDGHSVSSCSDDHSGSTHDQGSNNNSYRDLRDISPYNHSGNHGNAPAQYTYTHVNDAVPMKPPRNTSKMTPSPSCESVNNLAGIGLAGASSNVVFPRRMHFGWSRHKAMRDLSSHAEEENNDEGISYGVERIRIHDDDNGSMSSPMTSPGSEVDAYAGGILGDYIKPLKEGDDEGYMGSSPEMISSSTTNKNLSKSHGPTSARQKINYERPPVKQARSVDHLKGYR